MARHNAIGGILGRDRRRRRIVGSGGGHGVAHIVDLGTGVGQLRPKVFDFDLGPLIGGARLGKLTDGKVGVGLGLLGLGVEAVGLVAYQLYLGLGLGLDALDGLFHLTGASLGLGDNRRSPLLGVGDGLAARHRDRGLGLLEQLARAMLGGLDDHLGFPVGPFDDSLVGCVGCFKILDPPLGKVELSPNFGDHVLLSGAGPRRFLAGNLGGSTLCLGHGLVGFGASLTRLGETALRRFDNGFGTPLGVGEHLLCLAAEPLDVVGDDRYECAACPDPGQSTGLDPARLGMGAFQDTILGVEHSGHGVLDRSILSLAGPFDLEFGSHQPVLGFPGPQFEIAKGLL